MQHPVERVRGEGAATFNPAAFDANAIVAAAKQAGQKYIVITAKHHDGFAMWPTGVNGWNLRDHSGVLSATSCAELETAATGPTASSSASTTRSGTGTTRTFTSAPTSRRTSTRMKAQLRELVATGTAAVLWFDGEWTETNPTNPGRAERRGSGAVSSAGSSPPRSSTTGSASAASSTVTIGTPEQAIPAPAVGRPAVGILHDDQRPLGYAAWDTNFKSPTTLIRDLSGHSGQQRATSCSTSAPDDRGVIPPVGRQAARHRETGWRPTGRPSTTRGYTGLVTRPSWGGVSRQREQALLIGQQLAPQERRCT